MGSPGVHQARLKRSAEGVGFEPTEALRLQRFSRPPHSTALPPLRCNVYEGLRVMPRCVRRLLTAILTAIDACPGVPLIKIGLLRRRRIALGKFESLVSREWPATAAATFGGIEAASKQVHVELALAEVRAKSEVSGRRFGDAFGVPRGI